MDDKKKKNWYWTEMLFMNWTWNVWKINRKTAERKRAKCRKRQAKAEK